MISRRTLVPSMRGGRVRPVDWGLRNYGEKRVAAFACAVFSPTQSKRKKQKQKNPSRHRTLEPHEIHLAKKKIFFSSCRIDSTKEEKKVKNSQTGREHKKTIFAFNPSREQYTYIPLLTLSVLSQYYSLVLVKETTSGEVIQKVVEGQLPPLVSMV